jgi:hypothetical protein
MEKKFNILQTTGTPKLKDFSLPTPGIQTKPKVILGQAALNAVKKTFIVTGREERDAQIGTSKIFNTPIYSNITFNTGSYVDQNNRTINYAVNGLVIEDCLVTVMNTKNIIKTSLQGRNGTVKEYISDGDYQIKIEGRIYGNGMNDYPQELVQKLHGICLAPQSINLTSTFLKLFNIEDIVIESYNIDQQEGVRNCQPFVLNCVSDYPLILLKNAQTGVLSQYPVR